MGANQKIAQLEREVKLLSKQIERLAPMEAFMRELAEVIPEESYALYTKHGQLISSSVSNAIKAILQRADL